MKDSGEIEERNGNYCVYRAMEGNKIKHFFKAEHRHKLMTNELKKTRDRSGVKINNQFYDKKIWSTRRSSQTARKHW